MRETGFEKKQWLVQRDGQFVQVTELLYRLLEQANGERTLDGIAAGMSEITGRNIGASHVRSLLEKKLIPLGLVRSADGTVERPSGAQQGGPRSPLRINMRTRVVSPAIINPVTRVLQMLYWPPVAIAVLAATALAQGWLFFDHGIGHSVYLILYQPGYMLLLLALIVIATAFHEFGHAAALRYGGGEVRGMGVGLYLVYPAFYTDVTDNYRLSRWARVRTDLGGFYFNLIFALVMLGLYVLTHLEILLLAVVFVDLEIVQQTLPFVRLDGYWALADLTGLPDFFSQIVPFLRTVVPLPLWRDGRKLPNLMGWVKAVFALYISITVPLLLFLFFLMIKSVPRVLATAWDSMSRQGHEIALAIGAGNPLGAIAAAIQLILLVLPVIGMFYIFFNLGRRLLPALWRWSKPTPSRRVIGALGSVAALLLLAWLWAPQLPLTSTGPAALWRPIGANERGTIADAFVDLPFVEHAPRPTPTVMRSEPSPNGNRPIASAHHDSFLDALRNVPVLGGVVSAVAPQHGTFVDGLRKIPVLGGAVSAVVPRHGTVIDNLRTVPVVGGVVSHIAPSNAHSTPGSGGGLGTGTTSAPGAGHGSAPAQGSQSGATSGSAGNPGSQPGPVPGAGAGVLGTAVPGVGNSLQTPIAGVPGAVNGAVQTPVAGVSGAVNGAVQTPVAGVSGTINGAVKTPVAGAVGTVTGAVRTPVTGVVGTPVAGAVGTVTGAVKTPVANVPGAANGAAGAVQTPLAGVQGKVP